MGIATADDISRLIDTAARLREVRSACRQFLMLHAMETGEAYEDLLRELPSNNHRADAVLSDAPRE